MGFDAGGLRPKVGNGVAELVESLILIVAAHVDGQHIVGVALDGDLMAGDCHDLRLHEVGVLQGEHHGIGQRMGERELAALYAHGVKGAPFRGAAEADELALLKALKLAA